MLSWLNDCSIPSSRVEMVFVFHYFSCCITVHTSHWFNVFVPSRWFGCHWCYVLVSPQWLDCHWDPKESVLSIFIGLVSGLTSSGHRLSLARTYPPYCLLHPNRSPLQDTVQESTNTAFKSSRFNFSKHKYRSIQTSRSKVYRTDEGRYGNWVVLILCGSQSNKCFSFAGVWTEQFTSGYPEAILSN